MLCAAGAVGAPPVVLGFPTQPDFQLPGRHLCASGLLVTAGACSADGTAGRGTGLPGASSNKSLMAFGIEVARAPHPGVDALRASLSGGGYSHPQEGRA